MIPKTLNDVVKTNKRDVVLEFLRLKVSEIFKELGMMGMLVLATCVAMPVLYAGMWVIGVTVLGSIEWVFPGSVFSMCPRYLDEVYVFAPFIVAFFLVIVSGFIWNICVIIRQVVVDNWDQAKYNVYVRVSKTPTAS